MGALLDALRTTRVEETSPNGSVQVTVTGGGDTFIKLLISKGNGVDADLLAEEIESAVKAAWESSHSEQVAVHARFGLHRNDPDNSAPWVRDALAEIEEIECRATSSRGYVEAFLSGGGEILISFTQNSATRTDVSKESLELELNEAIVAARRFLAREVMRCYQRHHAA